MHGAQKCVEQKTETVIETQLYTALGMARENIADKEFLSLMELQVELQNK